MTLAAPLDCTLISFTLLVVVVVVVVVGAIQLDGFLDGVSEPAVCLVAEFDGKGDISRV